jgi:hypothetical protein
MRYRHVAGGHKEARENLEVQAMKQNLHDNSCCRQPAATPQPFSIPENRRAMFARVFRTTIVGTFGVRG